MTRIITRDQIEDIIPDLDPIALMEHAFISYSNGNAEIPPVGELLVDENNGEVHIKYGLIKNQDYYCIKIASGFYDNPKLGLPSNQGMMLLFNQKTGQAEAILLDEGLLTDVRTAAAGALCAKYFAPSRINNIGIIGTGAQARFQLEYLNSVIDCKNVIVWGRNLDKARQLASEYQADYNIKACESIEELCSNSNLIISTTATKQPLILAEHVQDGTHITAMGSDTEHKQEVHEDVLAKADILISDSIPQSKTRGEIFQAQSKAKIDKQKIIELGKAIQDKSKCRTNDKQITICDLTGVAVQDIIIANAAFSLIKSKSA